MLMMMRMNHLGNMLNIPLLLLLRLTLCAAWTVNDPGARRIQSQVHHAIDFHRDIVHQLLGASLGLTLTLTVCPLACHAGPVGEQITQVVTQSDVGVAVRRSVVRGAQVMDSVDASWERLSDQFGLGAARKIQPGRPQPKIIPDLKPLDSALAMKLLESADQAVIKSLSCSSADLQRQIEVVTTTVRPSFERSGLDVSKLLESNVPQKGADFNFLAYCRYKAYVDMFSKQQAVTFPKFQRDLEAAVGNQVLLSLLPEYHPTKGSRCTQWGHAVNSLELLNKELVARGLVADTSSTDEDSGREWCEDGGELTFSVALDGEATLGAQTLLQEQGYRLYPNFGRNAIVAILRNIDTTDVTVEGM